jgi:dTDP-4-amino-4,6-dideoxygalactose transaminase
MKIPFVDLNAQYETIKPEIDAAIQNVINESAFIGGKNVKQFEADFAQYIGAPYCIACGNGTDAIQIALKALDIQVGDEVIVPANSFIATSEAVTAAGGQVVFCDADDESNNLDTSLLEQKITDKTKAIIAVHLYGRPADMDDILAVAEKHNLKVIEDAAQAHGAKYKNNNIGTFGDIATFSFYPGKNLGAYGDGGAMVTKDADLAKKMRMWANHGRIDKYNHEFEGYNSRLDGIQAAILSAKLKHLTKWTAQRRAVASRYSNGLKDVHQIQLPQMDSDYYTVFHLYVIKVDNRDELQDYLKEKGIATGVHYPIGLPFLKAYEYQGHTESDFPVTAKNQTRLLSLPIFPEMSKTNVDKVINSIIEFFNTEV